MEWLIDYLREQAVVARTKAQEYEKFGVSADFLKGLELGWADAYELIARCLEEMARRELKEVSGG